ASRRPTAERSGFQRLGTPSRRPPGSNPTTDRSAFFRGYRSTRLLSRPPFLAAWPSPLPCGVSHRRPHARTSSESSAPSRDEPGGGGALLSAPLSGVNARKTKLGKNSTVSCAGGGTMKELALVQ